MAKTKAQRYRELLESGEFIVSPGVYDGYSARLVEAAGYRTAATSGAAISNSLLGIADIGVMGLVENVEHCRNLARSISIPGQVHIILRVQGVQISSSAS